MKIVKIPFLISGEQNLYVHFTEISQENALKSFLGDHSKVSGNILKEVNFGKETRIVIHGVLPWCKDINTISLSEYGLTVDKLTIQGG